MTPTPEGKELAAVADKVIYDPETGIFRRRFAKHKYPAGCVLGASSRGYVVMQIEGVRVMAHRFAWFLTYGRMPEGVIDHINGDRSDNRIANLRDVSRLANNLNSWKPNSNNKRTGVQGVYYLSGRNDRWAATIKDKGRRVHLGCFDKIEAADAAYRAAKQKLLSAELSKRGYEIGGKS